MNTAELITKYEEKRGDLDRQIEKVLKDIRQSRGSDISMYEAMEYKRGLYSQRSLCIQIIKDLKSL